MHMSRPAPDLELLCPLDERVRAKAVVSYAPNSMTALAWGSVGADF